MNMDFIEIQPSHSRHSSFSSIGDDRSLDLSDLQRKSCPSPVLVEESSLNMLTILASTSFEIEKLFETSQTKTCEVPSQITTLTPRKRTISQHDETATTFLSNSTCGDGPQNRQRMNSDNERLKSSGSTSRRSLSLSPLSFRDVASMLGSLSILDSSEQLRNPSLHHRGSCDQLPDAEELAKLVDGEEKSHRRNTQLLIPPTEALFR